MGFAHNIFSQIGFIGQGMGVTLLLLFGSLIVGFFLGGALGIAHFFHLGRWWIQLWISVLRGVPMILQLSFVFFALPSLLGIHLGVLEAGVVAFGLNSSAYMAEIFRTGLEGVPKGQFEAARSLGIAPFFMWRDIIFPQAVRSVFPLFVNEMISLMKETALISTIGGMDIMRMSNILGSQQYVYFGPLCIAGAYYYVISFVFVSFGRWWEKRNPL